MKPDSAPIDDGKYPVVACSVCGEKFRAELERPDQPPPYFCHAHMTQAPWYVDYGTMLLGAQK